MIPKSKMHNKYIFRKVSFPSLSPLPCIMLNCMKLLKINHFISKNGNFCGWTINTSPPFLQNRQVLHILFSTLLFSLIYSRDHSFPFIQVHCLPCVYWCTIDWFLFNQTSITEHLDSFQYFAIKNNASKITFYVIPYYNSVHILISRYKATLSVSDHPMPYPA